MELQIRTIREGLGNVQLLLVAMERQPGDNEETRLINDANDRLITTERSVIQLESQLIRENATTRQVMSIRVDQLKNDFMLTKNSLHAMVLRHESRRKRAKEKEELLTRRFTKNSETRVNLEIDHELDMNDKLSFSNNMIDQLLAQGASMYEELQNQKYYLLNVRKRFHFLTKSLGISDTTIQLIDKRIREDKKLFVIGVSSCLIFMFSFYYWWQA